jgi:hypothetical protein
MPAVPCNRPACAFPPPVKDVLSIPGRLCSHRSSHYAASFETTAPHPVASGTWSLFSVLNCFDLSGPARFVKSSRKILQVPIPARVCAIGMVNIIKD